VYRRLEHSYTIGDDNFVCQAFVLVPPFAEDLNTIIEGAFNEFPKVSEGRVFGGSIVGR
jgi:hypothetical protein